MYVESHTLTLDEICTEGPPSQAVQDEDAPFFGVLKESPSSTIRIGTYWETYIGVHTVYIPYLSLFFREMFACCWATVL